MKAIELAHQLARGSRVQDLTPAAERAMGGNRLYRLWLEKPRLLKVYSTTARERREMHALDMLRGVPGIPIAIDRGIEEDLAWVVFDDAGQWTLSSLPENTALARRAGEVVKAVHSTDPSLFTNMSRGIDQEWVAVDFVGTFKRLERYRGRLEISRDLIEAARSTRPPFASEPRVGHTDPTPDNFVVDTEGGVTLVNWEWATVAPPEWDLSRAIWTIGLRSGPSAAKSFAEGYGSEMSQTQLDRWTVYHTGMMLVYAAENRMSSRLDDMKDIVAELQRAVTGAHSGV